MINRKKTLIYCYTFGSIVGSGYIFQKLKSNGRNKGFSIIKKIILNILNNFPLFKKKSKTLVGETLFFLI
jgi:hypothetical protein